MKNSSWNRSAVLLIGMAMLFIPGISQAAFALGDWRSEISTVRSLAENDAPLAYKKAQRLQTDLPADASPSDNARILNLLARIEAYMALTAQAEKNARLAQEIAEKNADRVGQAEAMLTLILTSINQAKIDTLVDVSIRCVELLDGVDRPDLLGEAMSHLSMMYRRKGMLEESVTVAMQSMEIAKRSNNPLALAYAHLGLGIQFDLSGNRVEAHEHYLQMRAQAQVAASKMLEAQALRGIANGEEHLGNPADAERTLRKSVAMFREVGAQFSLNYALFGLADMLRAQGRHEEAIPLYEEIIARYGKYPNPIGLWFPLNSRSTSLQALGRFADARADAAKAYALALKINQAVYIGGSARRMAALAAAVGDTRRAYDFILEADKLADRGAQQNTGTRILELTQRYESDSAKHRIDELNFSNEQHRQRWLWSILGVVSILLIVFSYFLHRLRAVNSQLEIMAFVLGKVREAVYIIDVDNHFVYVNEESCRALGYSREELLGMSVADIDSAISTEELIAIKASVDTGGPYVFERKHKTKDGQTFPVEVLTSSVEYRGKRVAVSLVRNITERKRIERDLEESRNQLRGLIARREDVREEERKHLARELHDELGQLMTGLKMKVEMLDYKIGESALPLREYMQETVALMIEVMGVARNISAALRPAELDMGIVPALELTTKRFATFSNIRCNMRIEERYIQLDEPSAIALFRILQESLTNVAKHANAGEVSITLVKDAADYVLKVRDNGIGFDTGAKKINSFGLVGIRERTLILGGTVSINSAKGQGTEIIVRIPVGEKND